MYLIINLLLQPYRFKGKGNFGAKPSRQLGILSTTLYTTLYASHQPSFHNFAWQFRTCILIEKIYVRLTKWQVGEMSKGHYFGAMTVSITTISIMTLSIMTFSITTLSIEDSFATLSINGTQRNNTPTMLSVTVNLFLCWMLLGRVSLCRESWRHYFCSKFQKFLLHFFTIFDWNLRF